VLTLVKALAVPSIEDDRRIAASAGSSALAVAAVPVELDEAGRLDADLAHPYVRSSAPTGSPIADRAVAEVAAGPDVSIEDWLWRLRSIAPEIGRMALERLVRQKEDACLGNHPPGALKR
jgi:hypothetical protein